ncbi:acetyltransferase [Aeromonas dhakensis]|uniref:acetyltransferase n=1 Tax=Aeromonas dhakensis TaxID=196024 RepID=UPI00343F2859
MNVNSKYKINNLYVFGAGSFSRCILPLIRKFCTQQGLEYCFVVEDINGVYFPYGKLISDLYFEQNIKPGFFFTIAIADVVLRRKIAERCIRLGGVPINLMADEHLCYDNVRVGFGAILCAHSMATTDIVIGQFFHCNIYSYIEHDCIIGDFVTFSPRVSCNGRVHISDDVFIGAGAIIRNGSLHRPLSIGRGAIIGMGAVVTKDVPPECTVVGNPARVVTKSSVF